MKIEIEKKVLEANDIVAEQIRARCKQSGTLVLNIASSPGSGKTTLLEKILPTLAKRYKLAVIEGDMRTENDAMRLRNLGINAIQIQTGDACHLEANQVAQLLEHLNCDSLDLLIIENIGNLICPASYDLGEDLFIIMLSTAEGDDKPAKYPVIFHNADWFIINKIDLLPYVDFDMAKAKKYTTEINSKLTIFTLSARSGAGLDEFIASIETAITAKKQRIPAK